MRSFGSLAIPLLVACAVGPLQAQSRWVVTAGDNKVTMEVDTSRIVQLTDGGYRVFMQVTLTTPVNWNNDRSKPYQRGIDQTELNCQALTFRSISSVAYDQRGNVVGSQQTPNSTWSTALPGSYAEGNIRSFCSIAATKFAQRTAGPATPVAPIDPRWLIVGGNTTLTLRADTSRLRRTDSGYVHLFERQDFATLQRTVTVPISDYSYTIAEALYDCARPSRRYLSYSGYTPNGGAVFTEPGAPTWAPANPGSILENGIRTVCPLATAVAAAQVAAKPPAASAGPHIDRTGSAFPISRSGTLLTNDHVVRSCDQVQVRLGNARAVPARLVVSDETNDMAVLKIESTLPGALSVRSGTPIRPGDDVVAIGFPLAGFLADQPNVTTGTVSALAGLGNDSRYMQITSPIQPGNSGGPLLDLSGHLVGIVSESLNDSIATKLFGSVPQNVNFALNGSVIRAFLDAHSIAYSVARSDSAFSKGLIGSRGRQLTYRVDCWVTK
jgi:S1-C subfamily serine protease